MGISRGFVLIALLALMALAIVPVQAHEGPALTPEVVEVNLDPGQSVDIEKTVHTPAIPPLPDICFLADTTGSMGGAIANVQPNIVSIIGTVLGSAPNAQFCAAQYRDLGDTPGDSLDQAVTGVSADVVNAVNSWVASGGGDLPEAQLNALHELATDAGVGFRAGSTRVIVWFGDAPGHDPDLVGGNTVASVITDLTTGTNSPIVVIAIDVGALDSTGQATAITGATGGSLQPANPDTVAAAILAGLSNLPAEVAMQSDCAAPVSTSFDPASQTVPSGSDAVFTETITAGADAEEGQTYECDDWATIMARS